VGSSYLPSDLLAAFLFAQLEARLDILNKRRRIWEYYRQHLESWANDTGVRMPVVPRDCEQAYHMFYLVLPSLEYRQALIAHLKTRGILSVFHYVPLHLSEMGRKWAARPAQCPVTEDVSARLLRLPFYNDLTEGEQARVVGAIESFAPRAQEGLAS
jgi:dTDP-4-amino-4,6-dideoxygalactose transaminase